MKNLRDPESDGPQSTTEIKPIRYPSYSRIYVQYPESDVLQLLYREKVAVNNQPPVSPRPSKFHE